MKALHLLKQKLSEYETALKEKELHVLELSGRYKILVSKLNSLEQHIKPYQDLSARHPNDIIEMDIPFSDSEFPSYYKNLNEYRDKISTISDEINAMTNDMMSSRTICDMLRGAVQAYQEAIGIVEQSSLE